VATVGNIIFEWQLYLAGEDGFPSVFFFLEGIILKTRTIII